MLLYVSYIYLLLFIMFQYKKNNKKTYFTKLKSNHTLSSTTLESNRLYVVKGE